MKDKNYLFLKKKVDETFVLPSNNLHSKTLNNFFKYITSFFKIFPFKVIIPISIIISVLLYFLFGYLIIKFVSLLQYGF